MSQENYITISPGALELLKNSKDAQAKCALAMAAAMDKQNGLTVGHIQEKYLSFPQAGPVEPTGLRVQTGSLRRSLRASRAVFSAGKITSGIGGNVTKKGVNYLAAHELGAAIPPHKVTATNVRCLCFFIGGKKILVKSANIPAITLPARGMIRRGIADRMANYGAALAQAIVDTLSGGKGAAKA